ncbi:glycosyltransferase [Neobacillus sp. LXY-4]|uniref:glycosyltransferase n=1 Tax=Neobacillus sp. LXY-4 TaxID=3379826 RepID=UPI003EE05CC9
MKKGNNSHRLLYISSLIDASTYKMLFTQKEKPMHAANKYHTLLCQGLAENGMDVRVYSSLPINRSNCLKRFIRVPDKKDSGVTTHYIPVINFPIIRHAMVFIKCFFAALTAPRGTNVIYDVLVVSAAWGAALGASLRRLTKVGIVTDLPEFMQISSNRTMLKINNRLLKKCDGYVFLTAQMNEKVNVKKKPFIVLEGHVDSKMRERNHSPFGNLKKRIIIYAGLLHEKYGIANLCNAFIKCSKSNEELHLFGDGDYVSKIHELCLLHDNIKYFGNQPNKVVVENELNAVLLVNPRPSYGEFTKYSFPSKTLEYMVSGTPVLMTKLPGVPNEYAEYVYIVDDDTEGGLAKEMRRVLDKDNEELERFGKEAKNYALNKKNNIIQAKRLLKFIFSFKK